MRRIRKLRALSVIGLLAATVVVIVVETPQPAQAASITVNTNLDIQWDVNTGKFPTDGKCSLRAAIISAQNNSNALDVDCSTGAPVPNVLDTIQIDPSLAGTTLTLSAKVGGVVQPFTPIYGADNPLKIIGPTTNAASFKISGGNAVRPFLVGFLQSAIGDLTLANITVQNGNGANGLANAPAVSGQGGAMYASEGSKLTFDNTVFTANDATQGGAVWAEAPTITNNGGAYTSNHASDDGGAIYLNSGPSVINGYAMLLASNNADDKGGAIASNPGSASPFIHLERSLMRQNTTDTATNGGVIYIEPVGAPTATTVELWDSTLWANSSVLFSTASTQRFDLERITAKDTGNLFNGFGPSPTRNSIITGTTKCQFTGPGGGLAYTGTRNMIKPFAAAGDCGTNVMNPLGEVTNMAAALAQNGGPEVQQTFALLSGSNAIDNGSQTYCGTIDARSVARGIDGNGVLNNPQTGDCDVGAYEYAKYVVNFVTGTSTANEGAGVKNIQVKLRILDPAISSLPSPLNVPVSYDPASTAAKTIDFNSGANVTFPTGSVDGAIANYPVTLIQDNVAELFGEEAHFTLGSVAGVSIAEPKDHTLSIQDDDQAGVVVDDGGDGTNLAEATPLVGENITVKLQSQPDRALLNPNAPGDPASYGPPADVTMHVNVDRDCVVLWNGEMATEGDPFDITIANANWNTGQTMLVRPVDDLWDEEFRDETVKHKCEIRFTFTSQDPIYNATQDAYEANITDNDTAGIHLDRISGPNPLRENTADEATYELKLNSPPDPGKPLPGVPRADTVVTVDPSLGCDIGAGDGVPKTYSFTGANWDTPYTITVKTVNNLVVELLHQCQLVTSVTSGDPIYADLQNPPTFTWSPPSATEDIQDYDKPNGNEDDPPFAIVTTSNGDGAEVDEGDPSTPDKIDVVLERAPKGANVTFKLFANDDPLIAGPQVAVATSGGVPDQSASITFTPANWNVPQTMEIHAVDDDYDEADTHPWSVIASMDSTAPGFSNPQVRGIELDGVRAEGNVDVPVTITDDDTSAFDIRDTGGSTEVKEGSSDDDVDVRLATHPYADVDVTVSADSQCQVAGASSTTITIKAAEWNQPHLVTVHAVDDPVLEDSPHPCVLTFDAASEDGLYDALAPATKDVDVIDNEQADVNIDTLGGVAVSEAGMTDQFKVVLGAQPQSDVTVNFGHDGQTASVPSVTFTPANWNVAKTVDIAAVQDDIDETDPHTGHVTFTLTTTAPGYATAPKFHVDALDTNVMDVAVGDDDTAGVTLSKTNLTLAENGADDTFTVRLDSQPTDVVTIGLTATGLCSASPDPLTFTPGDWDQTQTVHVTPGNDEVDADATCTVQTDATSTDPNYAGIAVADPSGTVVDDDTSSVVVSPTTLTIAEGGNTDTYDVVLTSQPTANVVVTPGAVGLCNVSGALTFTPADWNTSQPVTVTSGNDDIDHVQSCTVSNPVTSADLLYDGFAASDVQVGITNDDTAGVDFSKTSLTLTESGPDDTYTVTLHTQPLQDVVITPTASGLCSVSGPLTFTSANWNVAKTVTVTPGNDNLVHAQSCTISHPITTTDNAYSEVSAGDVSGPVAEDDVAGVLLSKTNLTLVESGADDSYTIQLGSPPSADVTITPSASGLCSVGPASLTFTTQDWDKAQTVTVTPGNDDIVHAQSCTISHLVASTDPNYDGQPVPDASGPVTDDDTAGITPSKTTLSLAESGPTDTYTFVLTSEPSADVTVTPSAAGLCAVSGALTFTPANWDTPKTVTVTPGNDDIVHAQSCTISHVVTSADPLYDGTVLGDATGAVADDDTAAVTPSKTSLTLAESGADDTYTLVLGSQPTADVTVTPTATGLCSVSGALTFTPANWDTPKTVTVTPGNDDIVHPQSCTIHHVVASGDAVYDGFAVSDVSGPVAGDDAVGIELSKTSLTLVEAGADDTYTVVLKSEPTADVVVTPSATGLCSVSAAMTFTAADWDTAKTVTVTPGNDDVVHAQSCTITHVVTSADSNYSGLAVPDASGAVADDDTTGVVLSKTSLSLTESGADDTYTVKLASQPTADVTITPSASGLCSVSGPLTFTTANWSTAKTVTVTPGNDDIVHSQSCTVTHASASDDANYDGLAVSDASGPVADDDTAGVHLSKTMLTLTESGPDDSYTVVLGSQPTATVTVTPSATGLCSVSGALTFTTGDWDQPQTVTVTPGNDDIVHAQGCTIHHASTSSDPVYDAVAVSDASGPVVDDDSPGVILTDSALTLTEAGSDALYTVELASEPTSNVSVALSASGLCSVDPAGLSFSDADWNQPHQVTVTPGTDDIFHSQSCTIHHTVTSADPAYDAIAVADAGGPVADDDVPSVEPSKTSLLLVESGSADHYDIVLGSEPLADVVVTPSATGLCSVSGAMTFTSADWDTPQTVTVTPGNDDVVHAQSCTITHAVASADPAYDKIPGVDDVSGAVADDDTAGVAILAGPLTLHEAMPATSVSYSVVLQSQPTADVTVTTDTSDGQTTVDKPTLTFTAADWNVPQTVTVTVVDDTVVESTPHTATIGHAVSSADPAYGTGVAVTVDGTAGSDVTVDIHDDETQTAVVLSSPADDETPVTATATISGGDAPRTGMVQFAVDGADVGAPVAVASDQAALDLGILAVGSRHVTATYSGDALHDGSAGSADTEVTIVPRAGDDAATMDEDGGDLLIAVLGNDKGVTEVLAGSPTGPSHGTVSCSGGDCTYSPDLNFNGTDTFTYVATDGHSVTAPATVTVTVEPVNDAPEPGFVQVTVKAGESVTFDVIAGATDVDGDALTLESYGQPAHGKVTCTPVGSCTYTPDDGYSGPDAFTYVLSDGQASKAARLRPTKATVEGTANIVVTPVVISTTTTEATTTTQPTTTTQGTGVGSGGANDGGGNGSGGGSLGRTGADPLPLVLLGAGLLSLGAAAIALARRRRLA